MSASSMPSIGGARGLGTFKSFPRHLHVWCHEFSWIQWQMRAKPSPLLVLPSRRRPAAAPSVAPIMNVPGSLGKQVQVIAPELLWQAPQWADRETEAQSGELEPRCPIK